ncbi:AMP-binding protein [Micrococcales bacterium 31B]|nr:AMP-binding protein [Micrococcales bacterium 31B]
MSEVVVVRVPGGHDITTATIADRVSALQELLSSQRELVFLLTDVSRETFLNFFAASDAPCAVALLDTGLSDALLGPLIELYQPRVIIAPEGRALPAAAGEARESGVPGVLVRDVPPCEVHPDLAVLLTTSGSTGSPKFVRLSQQNIDHNTEAIVASLRISDRDVTPTMLPLHYSFGMSIANTYRQAGAQLVLTQKSVIEPGFWQECGELKVTSLSGVPSTYAMLKRLDFAAKLLPQVPSLTTLTQAGGKLAPELIQEFSETMHARGGLLYVMYGQTEAAPRLTCLPGEELPARLGSVGTALKDGTIEILDAAGTVGPVGTVGEIRYRGPNVMMGYAERPADLLEGDVFGDELLTGDLGYLDDEGFLFITGRTKRIAKISGMRVSLDEIEQKIDKAGQVAAVAHPSGDGVVVFCDWNDEAFFKAETRRVLRELKLPPKTLTLRYLAEIPTLANGKLDYKGLEAELAGEGSR